MSERCVAVNDSGRRCGKASVRVEWLHLEPELYGYLTTWHERGGQTSVKAPLCERHSPDVFRTARRARGKS